MNTEHIRQRLAREYQARCERNPRYSLRSFARSLDVSHSILSLVLSGKRKASHRMAAVLDEKSDSEAYADIKGETFERIATWMHYAVLGLIHLPGFDPSPTALSRRLGIGQVQASAVWSDLVSSHIVRRQGKKWVQTEKRITFKNSTSTPTTREFIRGFLKKADESLDAESFSSRNLTTITFCMDEKDVAFAAQKITHFRRKLCKELEERGKPNRVYSLAVQLFPLTRNDTEREKT